MAVPEHLICPGCWAALPEALPAVGTPAGCPACQRPLEGLVFPAFRQPLVAGKAAEAVVATEDAACFYHAQSRAQAPCDACGRFLCALCDVELNGRHLCPGCINVGRKKRQLREFDDSRVLYGGIAMLLALLPIFFWPITIITGPLSVFIALYGWNKPRSLTNSGRFTSILAILLGLLQSLAWAALFGHLFHLY